MSKWDSITICVVTISVCALMVALVVSSKAGDAINRLADVLEQPAISDTIQIDELVITSEEGVIIELIDFEATMNSRFIDLILVASAIEASY